MIYAHLTIKQDGITHEVKLVAENQMVYDEYKFYLKDNGFEIIDEFTDSDFGSIVILPEDFKY